MNKKRLILYTLTLGLLTFTAWIPYFSKVNEFEDQIDLLLEGQNHFNGVVGITLNDSLIYKKAIGSELTTNSVFKVGSITKQFTAALILKLVEEGKLTLSDTISTYFEDLKYAHPVTIKQLLNHTSGIPNYYFFEGYHTFKSQKQGKSDMYERIKKEELEFMPGENYKYSNSGYYLLGLIIERVTGKTWEEALRVYILNPLGLKNTQPNWENTTVVEGYKLSGGNFIESDEIVPQVPFSAGSMTSNLIDLRAWCNSLFGGFLSNESVRIMTEPGKNNYGLGLWVDEHEGFKRIWHTGGIDGFRSMMSYYPEEELNIIILTNVEGYPIKDLERSISSIVFNNPN